MKCPKCGEIITGDSASGCRFCGYVFEKPAPAPVVEKKNEEPKTEQKKKSRLVPCGDCGATVSIDARICPRCGKPAKKRADTGCLWIVFTALLVLAVPAYVATGINSLLAVAIGVVVVFVGIEVIESNK